MKFTFTLISLLMLISFNESFAQEKEKQTIVFIDDFDENSTLEPNYYKYFSFIKNDQLLGDEYIYERLNINFDLAGPNSIRSVKVHHANIVVLILGTSTTTVNTLDDSINITPNDYRNEYISFVRSFYEKDQKIIIMSPPPYKTSSAEEDKAIIDNINAVQEVAEESDKVTYVKLYKYILKNYQDSRLTPKTLSTWIVRLVEKEI